MNEKKIIARQQEFIAWLKSKGLYNEFATANQMRMMQAVWEASLVDITA